MENMLCGDKEQLLKVAKNQVQQVEEINKANTLNNQSKHL